MASHTHDFGSASALPLSAVLASLPSYPRPVIERLVTRLIDRLDTEDGDADLEDDDPAEDHEGQHVDADGVILCTFVPVGQCEDDENEHDAEGDSWSNPEDCPDSVFIGRRTPARQIGDE